MNTFSILVNMSIINKSFQVSAYSEMESPSSVNPARGRERNMTKSIAAMGMATILATFAIVMSSGSPYAAAQQQATDTFNASGVIGGTISSGGQGSTTETATANQTAAGGGTNQTTMADNQTSAATNATNNTTTTAGGASANPYILGGTWNMNVEQGNVSNLAIEFLMMRSDGSEYHSHSITNFRTINNTLITLDPSGTTSFSGTVDIYVNDTLQWPGVDTSVSIDRMVALTVEPAGEDTDNHFQGQPIHGIVASLQDQEGNQLVQAPAEVTGNQTQNGGGGGGGFLDRLTEPFEGLFGGGS